MSVSRQSEQMSSDSYLATTSRLLTAVGVGFASAGTVFLVLAFGLPYWVYFGDVITVFESGILTDVELKYNYGFWAYCNTVKSPSQLTSTCGSAQTSSDVEEMTVSLLTLAIVLIVNVFVNSVLYSLKNERLCLIMASLSAVASAVFLLVSTVHFGTSDHSVQVTTDILLSFSMSNLSASFWLAVTSCFAISVAAVLMVSAMVKHENKNPDELDNYNTSSAINKSAKKTRAWTPLNDNTNNVKSRSLMQSEDTVVYNTSDSDSDDYSEQSIAFGDDENAESFSRRNNKLFDVDEETSDNQTSKNEAKENRKTASAASSNRNKPRLLRSSAFRRPESSLQSNSVLSGLTPIERSLGAEYANSKAGVFSLQLRRKQTPGLTNVGSHLDCPEQDVALSRAPSCTSLTPTAFNKHNKGTYSGGILRRHESEVIPRPVQTTRVAPEENGSDETQKMVRFDLQSMVKTQINSNSESGTRRRNPENKSTAGSLYLSPQDALQKETSLLRSKYEDISKRPAYVELVRLYGGENSPRPRDIYSVGSDYSGRMLSARSPSAKIHSARRPKTVTPRKLEIVGEVKPDDVAEKETSVKLGNIGDSKNESAA